MKNIQLDHSAHRAGDKKYPLCFLAHDIDVPMNVGSFFRIADALGVEKIYLTGSSTTPPNSRLRKTSRATEKYVDFSYAKDPLTVINQLKEKGYRIVSLELTTASVDIRHFTLGKGEKICLILGSENSGVCQALLDASDLVIHIPMRGRNSSMNVANACSIASYEITRQFES